MCTYVRMHEGSRSITQGGLEFMIPSEMTDMSTSCLELEKNVRIHIYQLSGFEASLCIHVRISSFPLFLSM